MSSTTHLTPYAPGHTCPLNAAAAATSAAQGRRRRPRPGHFSASAAPTKHGAWAALLIVVSLIAALIFALATSPQIALAVEGAVSAVTAATSGDAENNGVAGDSSEDASGETSTEVKLNEQSYWSTENKPVFHGATKVTIPKSDEAFDIKDSRWRIFAKDFEDGDLTQNIVTTGTVDRSVAGTYTVHYEVTDSHNNTTELDVVFTVDDNEDAKYVIERSLYTYPSMWNMQKAGTLRCNNGDRQILGIYLPDDTSATMRMVSGNGANLSVAYIANDTARETSGILKVDGTEYTLQNTKNEECIACIPLITTQVLGDNSGPSDISVLGTVNVIELTFDDTVKPIEYYHYGDDEAAFRAHWKSTEAKFGVVENEVILLVMPYADLDASVQANSASWFPTLDAWSEYYVKVVDRMDEILGLSLNPENINDQNVRTQYLFRANKSGYGAAYYNGNLVSSNGERLYAFFQMNWGGLHEIAHGYQGGFGKPSEMNLGETSNNILCRYIQTDRSIYTDTSANWLGELTAIEDKYNTRRLDGEKYVEKNDPPYQLYGLINLFDSFEGASTYAKLMSWYRDAVVSGRTFSNNGVYLYAFAEVYGVNLLPYFDAWGITVTDAARADIIDMDLPAVSIVSDAVGGDASAITAVNAETGNPTKYGLATAAQLAASGLTGSAKVSFSGVEDTSLLVGKVAKIMNGDEVVANHTITAEEVAEGALTFTGVSIGDYTLKMPVLAAYESYNQGVNIPANGTSENTFTYTKAELPTTELGMKIRLLGYFNTDGLVLTTNSDYTSMTFNFGGSNMWTYRTTVKIVRGEETIVDEVVSGTSQNYTWYYDADGNKRVNYDVELQVGDLITIYHPGNGASTRRLQLLFAVDSSTAYELTVNTVTLEVIEGGLKIAGTSDESAYEAQYALTAKLAKAKLDEYAASVTERELSNLGINVATKRTIVAAFEELNEEDQAPYVELIARVRAGGTPVVTGPATIAVNGPATEEIDFLTYLTATDNEDGPITLTTANTQVESEYAVGVDAGTYTVTVTVFDSNGNGTPFTLTVTVAEDMPQEPEEQEPEEGEPEEPGTGEGETEPGAPEEGEPEEGEPEQPGTGEGETEPGTPEEGEPEQPGNPDEGEDGTPEEGEGEGTPEEGEPEQPGTPEEGEGQPEEGEPEQPGTGESEGEDNKGEELPPTEDDKPEANLPGEDEDNNGDQDGDGNGDRDGNDDDQDTATPDDAIKDDEALAPEEEPVDDDEDEDDTTGAGTVTTTTTGTTGGTTTTTPTATSKLTPSVSSTFQRLVTASTQTPSVETAPASETVEELVTETATTAATPVTQSAATGARTTATSSDASNTGTATAKTGYYPGMLTGSKKGDAAVAAAGAASAGVSAWYLLAERLRRVASWFLTRS